jgi:hypothetical protein
MCERDVLVLGSELEERPCYTQHVGYISLPYSRGHWQDAPTGRRKYGFHGFPASKSEYLYGH